METLTHSRLRAQEDALKRAFVLNGFTLFDDSSAPEIVVSQWAFSSFDRPQSASRKTMLLEDGSYALRSDLLSAQLPAIKAVLPGKVVCAGTVYDGADASQPQHRVLQAVWTAPSLPLCQWQRLANLIAAEAFGLNANVQIQTVGNGALEAKVDVADKSFALFTAGKATSLACALLSCNDMEAWIIEVDVDAIAMTVYDIPSRDELYSPLLDALTALKDDGANYGDSDAVRAANILRGMGFNEYFGLHAYEADCYKKMNMIQEAWDTNDRGIQLVEPIGTLSGLPTVLTPALEEALAANWKAGNEKCMIFELRHIFLPGRNGAAPTEKIALAMGAYGPDVDKIAWRRTMDAFFTKFGIKNHFFIPLPPGAAPAYHPADGWLLMDQNMKYQEGNFGSISPIALANHGIGTQAFMAMLEFAPLEKKAAEEFGFIAPELM